MFAVQNRLLLAIALIAGIALAGWLGRRMKRPSGDMLLSLAALGGIATLLAFAWALTRQVPFPLQLECMELTVLQHAERFAAGLPVYPPASADFVPLAYNPGLYVLLWPLMKMLGPSLALLRLPSVVATVLLIVLFAMAARRGAGNWRWSLVAAALPIFAMRSLDCYLTKGHGDTPMILCALAGALLLGRGVPDAGGVGARWKRSASARSEGEPRRSAMVVAALLFSASFWFKQHGALPALGAGLWLLLRGGRRAWLALLVLALLGPALYLLAGPALFGTDFHLSTFKVPSSWSHWGWAGPLRFARFAADWWAAPLLAAAIAWLSALRRGRLLGDPVLFLWPFALLSGLMGALDGGSSDNVFAMAGVWTLYVAVRALAPHLSLRPETARQRAAVAAIAVTFAMLVHDAREWVPSSAGPRAYRDLVTMLDGLDGPVYAPWLGDPPGAAATTSRAHWVALEDRMRGRERSVGTPDFVVDLLTPVSEAPPPAYLLTISPLEDDRVLSWLAGAYVLQERFGTRFDPVRELPTRFGSRTPRYLYRRADLRAGDVGAAPATATPGERLP